MRLAGTKSYFAYKDAYGQAFFETPVIESFIL